MDNLMLTGLLAEGIGARFGTCDVGMGASTTVIVCADLAGYGDDYFNEKFCMTVLLNANSAGDSPEMEYRYIGAYTSSLGAFLITTPFGANVEEGDKIMILHESVFLLGLLTDPTLAKMADNSWLAHILAIDGDVSDYNDATDSLEAISNKIGTSTDTDVSTDIANSTLSMKEKVFGGLVPGQKFHDQFNIGADNAAPDTTYWAVVEDNDATVYLNTDSGDTLNVKAGTVGGNDAIAHSGGLISFSYSTDITTELHIRAGVKTQDLTGEWSFGLVEAVNAALDVTTWSNTGTIDGSNFYGNNNVEYAHSADGTAEATDISAFIDGTTQLFEIVLTSNDSKFYVDGILRATHSNNNPPYLITFCYNFSTRNTNGITTELTADFLEIWTENANV